MSLDLNKVLDGYNPVLVHLYFRNSYLMFLLEEAEETHHQIKVVAELIGDLTFDEKERERSMEKTLPALCAQVHRLHMEIRKVEAGL